MPETLLITFLGTGRYQPARYRFGTECSETEQFFAVALASRIQPARVVTLETRDAREKHGEALAGRLLNSGAFHTRIDIPEGKSEPELWDILAVLSACIPPGSRLHLDITHGFRSLPMVGFIALNYLRVTRQATIGGIHYGAWEAREARDADPGVPEVPVFDLTPFLTLLDWTAGADEFLSTGSATRLGELLRNTHQDLWSSHDRGSTELLPKALAAVGKSIDAAAQNLILLRTRHLAESAASVARQLERAGEAGEISRHAAPFLEVLQPIRQDLLRFAGEDLETLRDLVGWLVRKGRPDAALTLANEWLVSWMMVQAGHPEHASDEKSRQPFERALGLWVDQFTGLGAIREPDPGSPELLAGLVENVSADLMARLGSLASRIKGARNDLNHAGFRHSPSTGPTIVALASEVASELFLLPLPGPADS